MLNKTFYFVIGMFAFGIGYAATSIVRVPCTVMTYLPSKHVIVGDPKAKYSVTFDGVWVAGYSKSETEGLVKSGIETMDRNIITEVVRTQDDTQLHMNIQVAMMCIGSDNKVELVRASDAPLNCKKGDSLLIKLYSPQCREPEIKDKKGIFTVTKFEETEVPDSIEVGGGAEPSVAAAAAPVSEELPFFWQIGGGVAGNATDQQQASPIPEYIVIDGAAAAKTYNRTASVVGPSKIYDRTAPVEAEAPQPLAQPPATPFITYNRTAPIESPQSLPELAHSWQKGGAMPKQDKAQAEASEAAPVPAPRKSIAKYLLQYFRTK